MIPDEIELVERLKDKPFALIGINSDGDRDVLNKICEENDIQPSVFYDWRNQLFENAAVALQPRRSDPRQHALEAGQRKVEELEARLAHKDQVIATLAERNIKLEKGSGGR